MDPVLEREGPFTRRKGDPGNEPLTQRVTDLAQPCKLTASDSLTRLDLERQDLAIVVLDDQIYLGARTELAQRLG